MYLKAIDVFGFCTMKTPLSEIVEARWSGIPCFWKEVAGFPVEKNSAVNIEGIVRVATTVVESKAMGTVEQLLRCSLLSLHPQGRQGRVPPVFNPQCQSFLRILRILESR